MKLNRNGYMFLAFVAILIICIIIVIALIARGCSKKPAETTAAVATSSTEVIPTTETTKATIEDKSAPVGYFVFSDSVGFRTWWDLFHYVYKIDLDNGSCELMMSFNLSNCNGFLVNNSELTYFDDDMMVFYYSSRTASA